MNLTAPFGGMCSLALRIGFKDDGAMEDVATRGKLKVRGWVLHEAKWLEGRKGVEGYVDGRIFDVRWDGGWLADARGGGDAVEGAVC